jgi:tRNA threonylcarbamoyladenosine biosynthesis protein TsaB
MRILLIETSSGSGRVGLAVGGRVVGERPLDEARRHARDLAPAVRDLLSEHGWKPIDMAAIFVAAGPGSYTGLRVGIMSAKAFAYAVGCHFLTVGTFPTIAAQAPPGTVEVISDAQKQRVYCQRFYVASGPDPRPVTALQILPFDAWLAQLPNDCLVSGPATASYLDLLPAWVRLVDGPRRMPTLDAMLAVGLARWQRGEHTCQPAVQEVKQGPGFQRNRGRRDASFALMTPHRYRHGGDVGRIE